MNVRLSHCFPELFFLLGLCLWLPSVSFAATRAVPSQYPTIQAGIDAAVSGDTVLVADGTYTGDGNRDLDFLGKSLTVKSEHGPTQTIIDCQGTQAAPHQGFYISRGERSVTLDGLTVTHGLTRGFAGGFGGGAYIYEITGSATLIHCVFHDNQTSDADGGGGGIYIYSERGTVTLSGCTFTNNSTFSNDNSNHGGGALIVDSKSNITVDQCVFGDNSARGSAAAGGGAYLLSSGGTVAVTNTTFSNDTADASSSEIVSEGGGVYINSHGSTVSHCSFENNVASGYSRGGGGAYINSQGADLLMTDCAFEGNTASTFEGNTAITGNGGGAFLEGTSPTTTVERCSFQGNAAYGSVNGTFGGGMYIAKDCVATKVTNCSFSGNQIAGSFGTSGGGVFINRSYGLGATSVTLTNCSFHGNTNISDYLGLGGGCTVYNQKGMVRVVNCIAWDDVDFVNELYFVTSSASTVSVTYSDIKGGYPGAGNRDIDPRFVNARAGDLHLQSTSPCLRAGTHTDAPVLDKDRKTRPNPPSIGAYDIESAVRSITANPSSVYGGETTTGTVFLPRAAPFGGTVVTLSSNTGYALVPSSVIVPVGASSKTFSVTSRPVPAVKAATITARLSGDTNTVSLLIYASAPKYLTLSPTMVHGGQQNSVGTVTLTSAAPPGGTLVTLSSNTGYASVPGSVTVAAGSRTARFTVTTKPVRADKGVTITALTGGITKSVELILTP